MARIIGGADSQVADVEVGTRVLVDTGLLHGVRGTILGSASGGRLIVMVRLLREITAFELPASWLRLDDGAANVPQPVTH
jgi:hypothetical protein